MNVNYAVTSCLPSLSTAMLVDCEVDDLSCLPSIVDAGPVDSSDRTTGTGGMSMSRAIDPVFGRYVSLPRQLAELFLTVEIAA